MNAITCLLFVTHCLTQASNDPKAMLQEWVEKINSPTSVDLQQLYAGSEKKPERIDLAIEHYILTRRAGKHKILSWISSSDKVASALVEAPRMKDYIVVTVNLTDPSRLPYSFRLSRPAEWPNPPTVTESNLLPTIKDYVGQYLKENIFSGSVAVAKDGVILYQASGGLASRAYRVANNVDTKFNLASIGKTFTAVLIGQLKDEGKLSFDDKVGKFLPNYVDPVVRDQVTIRQLLSHTSGMGDMFTQTYIDGSKLRWKTVDSMLTLFEKEPMVAKPGEGFHYSNAGFVLLGKIIEVITGKDYYSVLAERIFKPLKMSNTDAYELDREIPNLAVGYTHMDSDFRFHEGEPYNNIFAHVVKGSPAGGSFSTSPDMIRFGNALLNGKLMKPATLDEMTTPISRQMSYGLGFELNGKKFGHTGGFLGINSFFTNWKDSKYQMVVMSNTDNDGGALRNRIEFFIDQAVSTRK